MSLVSRDERRTDDSSGQTKRLLLEWNVRGDVFGILKQPECTHINLTK